MRRGWLSEPLVHFTLAAIAVFVAWQLVARPEPGPQGTIIVTLDDMERLAALYAAEAGTLPGPQDMTGLVSDHVRTQALAREARRLGLDAGDIIVERRLAQKMEFMVSDLAVIEPPSEAELRAWHSEHEARFTTPARFSFRHVFLGETREAADALLDALNAQDPPDWRMLGEPFMLQRAYGELPAREIARLFGPDFLQALGTLEAGPGWQGPVPSAYGWHLVRIDRAEPAAALPFEHVREAVEADWREAARRRANQDAVAEIIARYDVVIETE